MTKKKKEIKHESVLYAETNKVKAIKMFFSF